MSAESLVKFVVEALVFLVIAGVISTAIALLLPRVRRLGRATFPRVIIAGTAAGFVVAELWSQFSHRERFATFTFVICVLAAAVGTVVAAYTQQPRIAADRLRD